MSSVMVPTAEAGHRPSTSSNRRSVTVPTKLNGSVGNMTIDSTEPDGRVEMLFMCPSTKVISFSPRSNSTWSSSGERGGKGQKSETTGSLPWSSPTERTLASGSLSLIHCLPMLCSYFIRYTEHISSLGIIIPSVWGYGQASFTEVSVLVYRRQFHFRSSGSSGYVLSY